jgi:hypothetical protein
VKRKLTILLGTVAALSFGLSCAVAQPVQPTMPGEKFGGPGFGPPPFFGPMFAGPGFGPPPFPPLVPMMAQLTPGDMCRDAAARAIGHIAYLKSRLDLTAAQAPLWADIETSSTDIATSERGMCGRLPVARELPDLATRLGLAEQRVATLQQNLQKIAAPLRKLYEALTPDQRAIMDRALMPPMLF